MIGPRKSAGSRQRLSNHMHARMDATLDFDSVTSTGKLFIIAEKEWKSHECLCGANKLINVENQNCVLVERARRRERERDRTRQRPVLLDPVSFSLRRTSGIVNSQLYLLIVLPCFIRRKPFPNAEGRVKKKCARKTDIKRWRESEWKVEWKKKR